MPEIELIDLKNYSIVSWIKLESNSKVLCVNINHSALKLLKQTNPSIIFDCYCNDNDYSNKLYNYIFAFHIFENEEDNLLNNIYNYLNVNGTLFLFSENINAIAYKCGDIPKYNHIYSKKYIKNKILEKNFVINACYSILPSLQETQMIISENYMINEPISIRYVPTDKSNWQRIVNEGNKLETIKDKESFHNNANNYLFVLKKENTNDIFPLQITLSPDRGIDNFSITAVYSNKVEKFYPFNRNAKLIENNQYLSEHGINIISTTYCNGVYTMPYIKEENCVHYFKKQLKTNKNTFISMCDKYYETLLKSSNIVDTNKYGKVLERCYFDLVPLNCFVINDKFVFFDQEFYIENYSVDLIMWRTLYLIYTNTGDNVYPSIEDMFKRYGFYSYVDDLIKKSNDIINNLRNIELK